MKQRSSYCLVTGASQGIGKELAYCAGREGWNLLLSALPGTGLSGVAKEIRRETGVDVKFQEEDLIDPMGRRRLIATALSLDISILINNAGVGAPGLFDANDLDRIHSIMALNNTALVEITHRLIPVLERSGPSRILNVSSLSSYFPMPHMAVYAATKGFVRQFSLALRSELAHRAISVSVLCPSGVRTNRGAVDRIKMQGLIGRMTSSSAEEVASVAFQALLDGKAVVIPGRLNRLLKNISVLLPARFLAQLLERRFARLSEDKPRLSPQLGRSWS